MDSSSKRECMKIIKRKKPKQSMDILREIKKTKKKQQDKCLYRENSDSLRSSII